HHFSPWFHFSGEVPSLSCFSTVPLHQAAAPPTGAAPGRGLPVRSGHGGRRACLSFLLPDRWSRRGLRPVSASHFLFFFFFFLFLRESFLYCALKEICGLWKHDPWHPSQPLI